MATIAATAALAGGASYDGGSGANIGGDSDLPESRRGPVKKEMEGILTQTAVTYVYALNVRRGMASLMCEYPLYLRFDGARLLSGIAGQRWWPLVVAMPAMLAMAVIAVTMAAAAAAAMAMAAVMAKDRA